MCIKSKKNLIKLSGIIIRITHWIHVISKYVESTVLYHCKMIEKKLCNRLMNIRENILPLYKCGASDGYVLSSGSESKNRIIMVTGKTYLASLGK